MEKLFVSTAALIVTAGATTAFAADDDNDGYDDITGEPVSTEETTTTTEDTSTATTTTTSTAAGSSNPYTMGISVPLIGSDFSALAAALGGELGIPTANLLWALGDNWLDLGVGLRVAKEAPEPPATDAATTIGLELDVGYRMMKPTKGRVMPFLKPFIQFGIADFDAAGDTLILGAGATLGVDVMIVEQFTLGAQIGLGIRTDTAFDTFNLSTGTSALNATIWW